MSGRRWSVIVLLFFATIISYIDRQALSVNALHVRADLKMTAQDYSYLITAFLVAYTIGPALVGRWIDRIGAPVGMTIAIIWWSVAASLHAAAGSVAGFLVLRFCLGLGETATLPSAIRTIADRFSLRERAMATSIFSAGTAIGAVVAVPMVALATALVGWRASFLATGLLGFLWVVPWWLIHRLPDDGQRSVVGSAPGRAADHPLREPYEQHSPVELLRERKAWGILLGRFMVDPIWNFYLFWLPSYLVQQRGFNLRQVAAFGWIPFLATDVGSLTGGWISGRLLARGSSLTFTRRAVLASGAVGTLAGLPLARVSELWLSMSLLCCAAFAIGLWAPTVLTLCADIMPSGTAGTMTGLSSVGAGVGGIILTPVIGWLVDHYSYVPVFVLAALLPQVGFLLLATLVGVVEPVAVDARMRPRPTDVNL